MPTVAMGKATNTPSQMARTMFASLIGLPGRRVRRARCSESRLVTIGQDVNRRGNAHHVVVFVGTIRSLGPVDDSTLRAVLGPCSPIASGAAVRTQVVGHGFDQVLDRNH